MEEDFDFEVRGPTWITTTVIHSALMITIGWSIAQESSLGWTIALSLAAAAGVIGSTLGMQMAYRQGASDAFRKCSEYAHVLYERVQQQERSEEP